MLVHFSFSRVGVVAVVVALATSAVGLAVVRSVGSLSSTAGQEIVDELCSVAERGDLNRIRLLVASQPILVNANCSCGWSPLRCAVWREQRAAVRLLIDKGADVNLADSTGTLPIHEAVTTKDHTTVKMLIKAGAEVNSRDSSGDTPLHLTARFGDARMAGLLLKAGADVRATNDRNRTPADLAVCRENQKMAHLLR